MHGPTPRQLCYAYANGAMGRAQLIAELVRYPYSQPAKTDGYDYLLIDQPGSWAEVDTAVRLGFIGQGIYDEVFNLRHGGRNVK